MFSLDTHIRMLADTDRVEAFRQAIFKTVKEGDRVIDIGTGTGILALFAAQAGARKVYAIESGPVIEAARKIARDNGLQDRIEFVQEDSRKVRIPELADVVITETIGSLGIDEGVMDILSDARDRLLKPGGRIMPKGLALMAVPVFFQKHHPFLFLDKPFYDLEVSHLRALASNNIYNLSRKASDAPLFLSQPCQIFATDFYHCGPLAFPVNMAADFHITRGGDYHGILLFPETTLAEGVTLSTLRSTTTHWSTPFLPLAEHSSLSPGDKISFTLTFTKSNGLVWQNGIEKDGNRKVITQLSLFGWPSLRHLIDRQEGT